MERLVLTTIPNKEGGAAQEEGVLNSNEGVGEERSALRGHLQVRQGCVPPCLTSNAVKRDGTVSLLLNGDKIFCNTLNICFSGRT